MNEIMVNETNIKNMIYEIRGRQVMLDSDLALLYQCKNGTKDINKAVKRNVNKFPKDFYFQLTIDEIKNVPLRFQTGTLNNSNNKRGQHYKYLPHVFTEEGIAMLASVLHTDIAVSVSVNIMRTFVEMRKYISINLIEQKYINNLVIENHENIKILQESFKALEYKEKVSSIFFEGQIYDAYSLLMDILSVAKKEIIIIDNFAGKELLDILKEISIPITIISNKTNDILINKYGKQYHNVTFIDNKSFHDRFILIDKEILYHSGASFKDLGKKCFAINRIEDKEILNNILKEIK